MLKDIDHSLTDAEHSAGVEDAELASSPKLPGSPQAELLLHEYGWPQDGRPHQAVREMASER
jgi:hypothetical protein